MVDFKILFAICFPDEKFNIVLHPSWPNEKQACVLQNLERVWNSYKRIATEQSIL